MPKVQINITLPPDDETLANIPPGTFFRFGHQTVREYLYLRVQNGFVRLNDGWTWLGKEHAGDSETEVIVVKDVAITGSCV